MCYNTFSQICLAILSLRCVLQYCLTDYNIVSQQSHVCLIILSLRYVLQNCVSCMFYNIFSQVCLTILSLGMSYIIVSRYTYNIFSHIVLQYCLSGMSYNIVSQNRYFIIVYPGMSVSV